MMILQLKMDEELHRKFKMLCAERRSNMTAELKWLITRELEQAAAKSKREVERASKKK